MTGTKSTRERFGAVFFAFVMVTSMVAFGVAGFAGSAAAASESTSPGAVTQGANAQSVGTFTIDEVDDSAGAFGASGTASVDLPSGVTVNESGTDLGFSTTNGSLSNVRIADESTIRFDYSGFNTSAATNISFSGLVVDVAADASTAELTANVGTSSVTVPVALETPSIATDGTEGVQPGGSSAEATLTVTDAEATDGTPDGVIQNGTTVTISIPDSAPGVTFDQSVGLSRSDSNGQMATSNARFVDNQTIAVDVDETDGALSGDDEFTVTVGFNATRDAASATGIQLDLTTTPPNANGDVTVQSGAAVNVNAPSVEVNGGQDATLGTDADGQTGSTLPNSNQFTIISGADGDIADADGKNITVTIPEDAAFTFDQRAGAAPSVSVNGVLTGGSSSATLVDERTINVTLVGAADSSTASDDNAVVDSFALNTTAGETSNSTLQFAVNETGPTGTSANYIEIIQAAGDTLNGDGDTSNAPGLEVDPTAISNKPGSTITSQVELTNTTGVNLGALGGEEVTLEVTDSPSGASASLNTTSLTTDSNGLAEFNVTLGDAGGSYNVTAYNADNRDVNVTFEYTGTSGPIAQFNVTGEQNALIDTTDLSSTPDEQTAQSVYKVQLEDANGNVNTTDNGQIVQFSTSVSDSDATVESVADALNNDGTSSNAFTDGEYEYGEQDNDGVFYVFVSDPTPGDTDLTVSQGAESSTGTTTFFDTVDSVDVSLNSSTAAVDSDVEVSAVPQTSDGTTIAVANLSTTVTVNNTSVASPATQDIETVDDGTATATITADQNGTTFVNATVSGVTGSTELTVGGTGSPLGGTAGEYDADGDGEITISELANAGSAYTDGELTISELAEVGAAYTSSN